MSQPLLEELYLLKDTSSGNGFSKTTQTARKQVYAREISIKQSEFFAAETSGIKIEYALEICTMDYENEKTAEYNGREYRIYRTFDKGYYTELYLCNEG